MGETIVDGCQQIGVLAFVHGHAVFAVRHFRGDDLQTVVLGYAIGQHRVIVEYGDGVAGLDHLVHGRGLVDGCDGVAVFLGMFLGIGLAFGTGFRHDGLVVEVLIAFDVVIVGGDGHLNARLEVRVGEIIGRLALVGDRHARDDQVHLIRTQRLQCGIETGGLNLNFEAFLLGDGLDQLHVDADHLALLLIFERSERGVGTDLVGLALGCRRVADFSGMGDGSSGRKAQNRNRNDHQQRAQANPCTTK